MEADWDYLQAAATEELDATLSELPGPLRDRASTLPVTFEPRPNAAHLEDGIEADTLGLFVGPEYAFEESSTLPLPPQIILFIENLWELANQDEIVFRREVRTTYMHELGHYLGLDEEDLYDCGLD